MGEINLICYVCKKKKPEFKNRVRNPKKQQCKICRKAYVSKYCKNPTFRSYANAKKRCNSKDPSVFKLYGGKGIKFMFSNLQELKDAIGERPQGTMLGRIDVEDHYKKGNVKWVTSKELLRNRGSNTFSHNDIIKIKTLRKGGFKISELALLFGASVTTISDVVQGRTWHE